MHRTLPTIALLLILAGCGTPAPDADSSPTLAPTPTPTATEPTVAVTATDVAGEIAAATGAVAVTTITEENDPNDLIGRPTGYVDAAVINAAGFECPELGVSCGATVEVWPTAEGASARADYIMGIIEDAPMFGTEYHYLAGPFLLRVAGAVVPSATGAYEAAFIAAVGDAE